MFIKSAEDNTATIVELSQSKKPKISQVSPKIECQGSLTPLFNFKSNFIFCSEEVGTDKKQ